MPNQTYTFHNQTQDQRPNLQGFRYICRILPLTCAACLHYNGFFFRTPEEDKIRPQLPQHPNCKCFYLPVQKRKQVEDVTTPTGLLPNNEYIENGFHYYTDMHGRVIRAQGILQKQRLSRNYYNQSLARRLGHLTDDGGHLIAQAFWRLGQSL